MITKYVEFTIICDRCGIDGCLCSRNQWVPNPSSFEAEEYFRTIPISERGVREMRKFAREFGWKTSKGGGDICPKCQAALKAEGKKEGK